MPFEEGNKLAPNRPGRVCKQPSELLAAYRKVFKTAKAGPDETEEMKLLRKIKQKSPDKFMARLERLELAHQNKGSSGPPSVAVQGGGQVPGDVGKEAPVQVSADAEERALGLIEEWRKDYQAREVKDGGFAGGAGGDGEGVMGV